MEKKISKAVIIFVLASLTISVAAGMEVIPSNNNVNLVVSNNAGARFNDYSDNTYNFFSPTQSASQGLNALHITTSSSEPSGQVTFSNDQSGVFYLMDTGGRGWDDDGILMLAVNGTVPDNFRVTVKASGYCWEPVPTGSYPTFENVTYIPVALEETFVKDDFLYGPQIWRPCPTTNYPVFDGQNMADSGNTFSILFIDLNTGILGSGTLSQPSFSGQSIYDNGAIKVDYSFENLTTFAAFDGYAYTVSSNQGQGIRWTNRLSDTGSSGYSVTGVPSATAPVAEFEANITTGDAPLTVQFTDTSTGSPTSWSWTFGDGDTSDEQNPSHTYTTAGFYTVNLTVTNADGSDFEEKADYINVTEPTGPAAPIADFTADPFMGDAPLSVQFTDTSTGSPTSWLWTFGDGDTSDEQNPSHTYTVTGLYTVNLTVTNAGGSDTLVRPDYIHVSELQLIDHSLQYSTFLGGSNGAYITAMTLDSSRNIYVCGYTTSADLPMVNPFQPTYGGGTNGDAFVAKLSADGSTILYSTYLGGSGDDKANGIALDPSGNIYVTGQTKSTDFPTMNPIQISMIGSNDAYVTKLNPTGSGLVYSTYLGGSGVTDWGLGISSDSSGNTYVTGYTNSDNFPVSNAYQPARGGGGDTFVTKINPDGSEFVYSTYLGGSGNDASSSYSIGTVADSDGNVYVAGLTASSDFPVLNAYQSTHGGGNDAYVAKYNSTGTKEYATFLGGSSSDYAISIALDNEGAMYVTGKTASSNYPVTSNVLQPVMVGTGDYFVSKLNPEGDSLDYSTFLGGSSANEYGGWGIAVDSEHNAYVTGYTAAQDFPLVKPVQPAYGGGTYDATVSKINPEGSALLFSSYLGGSSPEYSTGIATDDSGTIYAAGYTTSSDFPLKNPLQSTFSGSRMGYIQIISPVTIPVANFTANLTSGNAPLTVRFFDTTTGAPTSWAWDFENDGIIDCTDQSPVHVYTSPGIYSVNLTVTNAGGSDSEIKTDLITVTESSGPVVLPGYNNIFVGVANEAGVKYDFFGNDTYNIRFEGVNRGLNALHISTDPSVNFGQVTLTDNQAGTFYVTDSGGKGYEDEIILLVAVNGTIPDDFSLRITSDGYTWTPNPVLNQPPDLSTVIYQPVALDETFTKADFMYGPQIWKPTGNEVDYPLFAGQDMGDTGNTFQLMFVDLDSGVLRPNTSLMNQGAVRINYSFQNPGSFAAFNVYAYCNSSNNGDGMVAWTNALTPDKAMSGYSVYRAVPPGADFIANVTSGPAPLSVQFTDSSTGVPTSWSWTFGDGGTSAEQNPSYTYATAGNYSVNLTVSNAAGSDSEEKVEYITVTEASAQAPVAAFSATPTSGIVPLSVQFTDESTDSPTSWSWSFGDGYTSAEQNPAHTYASEGSYQVNLTVSNALGTDSEEKVEYITVTEASAQAPVAAFSANVTTGNAPLEVQFTDESTNSPTSWSWTFGDGGTSIEQNPSHTYTSTGTYTVTLTATNAGGTDSEENTGYIQAINPNTVTLIITPQSSAVTVGSVRTYSFSINCLPEGLSGMNVTVALSDPSVGEIVGITMPAWAALNDTSTFPADSVWFGGVDIGEQVQNETTNVPLGSIAIRADAVGITTLVVTVPEIDNDYGYPVPIMVGNAELTAYQAVITDFTADVTTGTVPFTVQFTDLSTGDPAPSVWAWDFNGDGTIDSTVRNPSFEYATPGKFTVSLTASNGYNQDTLTRTNYIVATRVVEPFPGQTRVPTDPDFDGRYEDTNGNGRMDFDDVVVFYKNLAWVRNNTDVGITPYDFNGNGLIDFDDVVKLFVEVVHS